MLKNILITASAGTLTLFLLTACAEDAKDTGQSNTAKVPAPIEKTEEKTAVSTSQDKSIMSQPVNFSTPEDVEKTLQNIREEAGDDTYNQLKNAMQYMLVYDLGLSRNKEKLYQKLNGKTPEKILEMTKR